MYGVWGKEVCIMMENELWTGLGEGKGGDVRLIFERWTREWKKEGVEKEAKLGPRAHFPFIRPESGRKKFT